MLMCNTPLLHKSVNLSKIFYLEMRKESFQGLRGDSNEKLCVFHHSPLCKIFTCCCLTVCHNNFSLSFLSWHALQKDPTLEKGFSLQQGTSQMEGELPCPGSDGAIQAPGE